MSMAITFSRQNDVGSRVHYLVLGKSRSLLLSSKLFKKWHSSKKRITRPVNWNDTFQILTSFETLPWHQFSDTALMAAG